MIQRDFLIHVSNILSEKGVFIIKTDDDAYAQWIHEHLDESGLFEYAMIIDEDPEKHSNPANSTEFETIWRKQ